MTKNTIRQKAKQATTDQQLLLVAQNQIQLLREQIEFWREQVESLNSELQDKEQELQVTEQELNYTNKELCSALMFERVNLAEAKELSKIILKNNKSASKSLADLLSAIYDLQVQPEELEQIDNTSMHLKTIDANESINNSKQVRANSSITRNKIINNSKQIRTNSETLKCQYKELGFQFVMLLTSSKVFSQKIAEFIAESREIKNVNNAHKNTLIELSPPPSKHSNIKIFNQY